MGTYIKYAEDNVYATNVTGVEDVKTWITDVITTMSTGHSGLDMG
jgi:hypothetical protein